MTVHSHSYYGEYFGHPVRDLEEVVQTLRAQGKHACLDFLDEERKQRAQLQGQLHDSRQELNRQRRQVEELQLQRALPASRPAVLTSR